MSTKHRLIFVFSFSGGVFRVRALSPGAKWAQNTAWFSVFNFQAVFSDSGRRFTPKNGRKTPPGSQFLIFRRCFQSDGAASQREMDTKHCLAFVFSFSSGVFRVRAPSDAVNCSFIRPQIAKRRNAAVHSASPIRPQIEKDRAAAVRPYPLRLFYIYTFPPNFAKIILLT